MLCPCVVPTYVLRLRAVLVRCACICMLCCALQGVDSPAPMLTHYAGGPCYPANPTAVTVLTAMHPDELKDVHS